MSLPHFLIRPKSSLKSLKDLDRLFWNEWRDGGAFTLHRALHNFPRLRRASRVARSLPSRLHRALIAPRESWLLSPTRLKRLARWEARSRVARWPHRAFIAPRRNSILPPTRLKRLARWEARWPSSRLALFTRNSRLFQFFNLIPIFFLHFQP
jgi:hypothetical protein